MFTALRFLAPAALVALLGAATCGSTVVAADAYKVDPVHSSISFMTSHAGISFIHGRFNDYSGEFVIDKQDPAKSSFTLSIKIDSIDTNNQKRDEHLRAADYFDAKQFPTIDFRSESVKPIAGGYEVAGALTLRGVTKPVTLTLKGADKTVEFPKGVERIGIVTTTSLQRSDFNLKAGLPSVGDEVLINIAIEAAK